MSLSINGAYSSVNQLNRAHSAANKTLQKIATGSQHPSASYGASEYAITQRMYTHIGSINQSNANAQTSNSMLKTASGAVNNTVQSLTSLRESIVNAMNDTNGAVDRSTLQKTFDQTVSQINENASVTYNGKNLLDADRTMTVAGVDGYNNVDLGNMTSEALGLTDSQGNSTVNLNGDLQNALGIVDNALSMANSQSNTLESALDEATTIGAQQQRLEYQSANYTTMAENELNAVSTLDDADIAKEVTNLKSQQTQEQLAMFATRMHMHNSANVLSLLQQ